MTKPLTELFEKFREETWQHLNPDVQCGADSEAERREPIDLATKKLIEALEFYAGNFDGKDGTRWVNDSFFMEDKFGTTESAGAQLRAEIALAEFRARLEDGE